MQLADREEMSKWNGMYSVQGAVGTNFYSTVGNLSPARGWILPKLPAIKVT